MKKKKKETMAGFMKRRNKETGKVTVPETKPRAAEAGGSHQQMARMVHQGVVKKKTANKLKRIMHNRKKKAQEATGL